MGDPEWRSPRYYEGYASACATSGSTSATDSNLCRQGIHGTSGPAFAGGKSRDPDATATASDEELDRFGGTGDSTECTKG